MYNSSVTQKFLFIPQAIKTPFLLVYLSSLFSVLITLTLYFRTQPIVPIFYSLAEPAQHLANKEWLFLFPTLSIGISILHTLLLKLIAKAEPLLIKLFAWTSVVIQVVLLLAIMRILYIIS